MMHIKRKRLIIAVFAALLCLALIGAAGVAGINAHVKSFGAGRIISVAEAAELDGVDCILVLGCKVHNNRYPSVMLKDRLDTGIGLYELGVAPKLLMSGDHGQVEYDEVNAMKQYAIDASVASEDIFMDHAGFSTYESVYRAKAVFCAEKIVIVTQEYHLYRALYIAHKLGLEAYGVVSDVHAYGGQEARETREVLARVKDFAMSIFKPDPKYLGDTIPVSGNGDVTNDKA